MDELPLYIGLAILSTAIVVLGPIAGWRLLRKAATGS